MPNDPSARRSFLRRFAGAAGLSLAAAPPAAPQTAAPATAPAGLPAYARAQHHRSLKQGSFDVTGGNADAWP
ncbi:MAG TPA: DUF2961 domain-containing protein, partial [Solibacterales bacterium]|nr:DUF2961 domain-containing protein [Bryobacterales bacterium]